MSTNEFARILLTWIKSFLSWIGIPRDRLNELDEIIFLILIVVIAFADFIPTIKIIVFKLFGHELYGNYRCFRQYCKICIVRVFYSLSVSFSWLKQ